MADESAGRTARRALATAAVLNALLATGLGAAGWAASSSALLANALDNASDTFVYVITFVAATRGPAWKSRAAVLSGVALLILSVGIFADAARSRPRTTS